MSQQHLWEGPGLSFAIPHMSQLQVRVNTSCELPASTWVTISMMDWIHAWESQSHLQAVSRCQSQSLTGVMNPDPRVIIYLWTKSISKNHNSTFQLPPDVKFRSSSVVCIHVGGWHFLLWAGSAHKIHNFSCALGPLIDTLLTSIGLYTVWVRVTIPFETLVLVYTHDLTSFPKSRYESPRLSYWLDQGMKVITVSLSWVQIWVTLSPVAGSKHDIKNSN